MRYVFFAVWMGLCRSMKIKRIRFVIHGLVGLTKAKPVRCHDPHASIREDRDHLAIEITPTWFSVQAEEYLVKKGGNRSRRPLIPQFLGTLTAPGRLSNARPAYLHCRSHRSLCQTVPATAYPKHQDPSQVLCGAYCLHKVGERQGLGNRFKGAAV